MKNENKKKNRNESRVKRYWVNKILNKTDVKPTGERERGREKRAVHLKKSIDFFQGWTDKPTSPKIGMYVIY